MVSPSGGRAPSHGEASGRASRRRGRLSGAVRDARARLGAVGRRARHGPGHRRPGQSRALGASPGGPLRNFWLYVGGSAESSEIQAGRGQLRATQRTPAESRRAAGRLGAGRSVWKLAGQPSQLGALLPTSSALQPIFPAPSGTCSSNRWLFALFAAFPSLLASSHQPIKRIYAS